MTLLYKGLLELRGAVPGQHPASALAGQLLEPGGLHGARHTFRVLGGGRGANSLSAGTGKSRPWFVR